MESIQKKSAIWDLHIHTCDCPKGTNEFRKLNREDFITKIIEIFDRNDEFELFSFTDHNQISIEVYEEYLHQKGKTEFLVGVEQDVCFNPEVDSQIKHLIIYFNIDKSNFNQHRSFMNDYNNYVDKKTITISELLEFLIKQKIKFVLSPHAFKQGKRGIEYKWTTEDIVKDEAHKYTDQFFCFWEAQGYSEIAKAIEFLHAFELDKKTSVISFSDSNNFEKLTNYINNPNQYFTSLPNFKGLELIATESKRILFDKININSGNFGNLIGKVKFNGEDILFSNKLNCIIGGRGSGKSLLLDAIANNMKDVELKDERKEYVEMFSISVYNYSNNLIEKNNFSFDYFKQAYVADLFDSNDYYHKIEEQFKDELNQIQNIPVEEIKEENKRFFISNIQTYPMLEELDNISDFVNKYSLISDTSFKNSYNKQDKSKKKIISYEKYNKFNDNINKLIPKELQDDTDLNNAIVTLYNTLMEKTHKYNLNLINTDIIKNIIIDKYFDYKKELNDANKEKAKVEDLIKKTFENKGLQHSKRVNLINSYNLAQRNFHSYYEKCLDVDGEVEKAFKIKKILQIETPYEYLIRVFKDYFYLKDLRRASSEKDIDLDKAVEYYCFKKNPTLKDGKTLEKLDEELMAFDLKYDYHPQILYLSKDEYEDILNLSPGTQTNILMEYLVYKDTDKPILIDQPEDNVDNQTIYSKLRVWFSNLKLKRQVIVVTHDANIVINADAENVIVANHDKKDKFKYSNGALEYKDNLEIASDILDGGKEAVKRRLMKYGE
ncbi:MAG: hypothetical protein ACLTDX_10900 [[Clostridium] innocuum]|uniref:hypothetical protein n=1 Tax=Clostridium sp. TaxID=1506 RepID=UPI003996438B